MQKFKCVLSNCRLNKKLNNIKALKRAHRNKQTLHFFHIQMGRYIRRHQVCFDIKQDSHIDLTLHYHIRLYLHQKNIQKQSPEVFCKKGGLKNFAKLTEKQLRQGQFFNKVGDLQHLQTASEYVIHQKNTENLLKQMEYGLQKYSEVLKKRCFENMKQIFRRTPMLKCHFNKVVFQLYWNCTFGMNVSCKFVANSLNTFS